MDFDSGRGGYGSILQKEMEVRRRRGGVAAAQGLLGDGAEQQGVPLPGLVLLCERAVPPASHPP